MSLVPHSSAHRRGRCGELLRLKGYSGTGVKEIVATAQAPFGSLYHHFPGGKEQLGAEIVRWSGREYAELGPLVFDAAPDVVTGVRLFFAGAAENLAESGWVAGCPIATVALEVANTSEPLRIATAETFTERQSRRPGAALRRRRPRRGACA